MSAIILDLDNTISNDGWRIPAIDWTQTDPMRRYHRYHSLAPWDKVGNTELFSNTPHDIIILTARPGMYRHTTEEWLRRMSVPYRVLLMRNNNDNRPSMALKKSQLTWLNDFYGFDLEDIVAAYDDREDVCEMYRAQGIEAHVTPIHNVCAYTKPKEQL